MERQELHNQPVAERCWFAVYTTANHEKKVAVHLASRRIEYYLPTYTQISQWKDRKVKLERPLLPGYVFVRIHGTDRLQVVTVPGVVYLVGVGPRPVRVPDGDIEALRKALQHYSVEPHVYLRVGMTVRIEAGPLAGVTGVLTRQKTGSRVVISVDAIQQSYAVEIDERDVRPLPKRVAAVGRAAMASSF
jgi:transcription antitermination factor NusG